MDAKAIHDRLLEQMPPGAQHPADCPMCAVEDPSSRRATASEDAKGGQVDTLTKAEHEAAVKAAVDQAVAQAVAAATAPLTKELDDLKAAAGESEIDTKVKAAIAEVEAKAADLQTQLDAAVLEAKTEKDQREALESYLEGEKNRIETETAAAARKDDRVKAVREAANFPDAYIEANADRFAAMADDEFDKALADWKAISGPSKGAPPKKTALTAAADDEGGTGGGAANPIKEVMGMRLQGIDPRQITSREA